MPMQIHLDKIPFAYVLAMPGLERWKRCSESRHILLHIFRDAADVNAALGLVAWHAPQPKEVNGYNLICPPEPLHRLAQPATVLARGGG